MSTEENNKNEDILSELDNIDVEKSIRDTFEKWHWSYEEYITETIMRQCKVEGRPAISILYARMMLSAEKNYQKNKTNENAKQNFAIGSFRAEKFVRLLVQCQNHEKMNNKEFECNLDKLLEKYNKYKKDFDKTRESFFSFSKQKDSEENSDLFFELFDKLSTKIDGWLKSTDINDLTKALISFKNQIERGWRTEKDPDKIENAIIYYFYYYLGVTGNRSGSTNVKYMNTLERICKKEKYTWLELANNITKIVNEYDNPALRLYKNYLDEL